VGLGLEHTQADIARAVLEGVGHAAAEAVRTYAGCGVPITRVIAIGGATKNPIVMSTVSTVTGLTQEVAATPGAAHGDAFLAALGTGAVTLADGRRWWSVERSVPPDPTAAARLEADHMAFVELYRALAPWNRERDASTRGVRS
jgi:xylulokinase